MKSDVSYGVRGLLSIQLFLIIINDIIVASVPSLPAGPVAMGKLPPSTVTQPLALPAPKAQPVSTK